MLLSFDRCWKKKEAEEEKEEMGKTWVELPSASPSEASGYQKQWECVPVPKG